MTSRKEKHMEIIPIWQHKGCGTDNETLWRIIEEYKINGTQDIESHEDLKTYIERVGDEVIKKMLIFDKETTTQMLADTQGIAETLKRINKIYAEELLIQFEVIRSQVDALKANTEMMMTTLNRYTH